MPNPKLPQTPKLAHWDTLARAIPLAVLREAAPLSTDAGKDLVGYASGSGKAATIQVKANLRAEPGGGKARQRWIGGGFLRAPRPNAWPWWICPPSRSG